MTHSALEGRVAIITGASSGIGEAVARTLARAGAPVVLGARREDRLVRLEEEIVAEGGRAAHRCTDVTRRTDLGALTSLALERFGSVDILVNNAGVMPLSPVSQLRVDDWERMVDVNLKGVLFGIAAVLPHMLERERGHIVSVGSVAGRRPFPGAAVYSATKFAVRSLTWGMQLELSASRGIRVTDIQPGMVDTELLQQVPNPETRRRLEETWKDRRTLVGADVAGAVLYAVSAPEHVNVNEILIRPTDQPT
jgi:NADP-dependent 3-hydroxy acid dehydrogenase YdfG